MNREIKFRGYAVEEMINSQWIEDAFGVEGRGYRIYQRKDINLSTYTIWRL